MTAFWASRQGRMLSVLIVVIALLLRWEGAIHAFDIKPFLLPSPIAVVAELADSPGWYAAHAGQTLLQTFLGFALAVALGIVMAVGIVYSRWIEQSLYTILVGMNAIPKVAVAPLFIVWLGTGLEPKVAIAFLIAVFPIVIDTVLGLRSVDPDLLDLARSLRGSRFQVLRMVRFPNALPSLFAGMKVGISFAFIGAIVGEFVASSSGLGYVILSSQATFDTTRMFAAIFLLAIIGTILFYMVELAEKAFIPWHVSRRKEGLVQP